tara:strand:+ start:184 stop:1542 length:1359 start_codon:yes stop_codon:yes gene_type:complete
MSLGKNSQSSSQTFDPELKGMLTSTFRTGQQLAQTPYQPYNAATVAPLSAAELEGMNMTADTARAGVGQAQMNQAITGAQAGMNFQPTMASAQTVGNKNVSAQNVGQFNPVGVGNIASGGVNAQQIGALPGIQAQNVGGQTVQAQSLANTNLDPYQNQYTSGVIDAAMGDLNRAREMTQNQNAASAVSAGAFGGDRQALVEAETNRNFGRQASDMAMNLRNQGFQNAQAAAQTDLNRAQDAGGQNAQSAMQAALANQQAGLSAGQQNQQLNFARQQANQNSALSAAQDSAGRAQQASQQMSQMGLQSGLASQDANMRAALANQQANLQAGQFNAGNYLQAQQGNQDAALRAALANQQAGLAGAGQRLQAGQNLANFGGDLRGMQFADAQALQGVGGQQRMAGQQLLDDRYRRFAEQRDNPFRMFDVLRSGAGLLPNPLSSQSKGSGFNAGVG